MKDNAELLFFLWVVAGLLFWFNIAIYAGRALGLM